MNPGLLSSRHCDSANSTSQCIHRFHSPSNTGSKIVLIFSYPISIWSTKPKEKKRLFKVLQFALSHQETPSSPVLRFQNGGIEAGTCSGRCKRWHCPTCGPWQSFNVWPVSNQQSFTSLRNNQETYSSYQSPTSSSNGAAAETGNHDGFLIHK